MAGSGRAFLAFPGSANSRSLNRADAACRVSPFLARLPGSELGIEEAHLILGAGECAFRRLTRGSFIVQLRRSQ